MQSNMQATKLGNIARIIMGQSPSSLFVSKNDSGVPFLQGNAEFGAVTPFHNLYCSYPTRLCAPGDTLISVRAPVGDLNKADRIYCIGRGLAAIRFTKVLPEYGWHLLNEIVDNLHVVAQGTTFEAINKFDLENLSVIFHTEPNEQRYISDILDTIDLQILYTEQLIAKLNRQKAGLLHDLLTFGLDEHGQLRDPVAHPEQFKDGVVGTTPVKITKYWEITTLGNAILPNGGLIQTGPFGSQLHAFEYVPEGVPVIMPQDILSEYVSQSQIAHITLSKSKSLAKHHLEFNDVVFARRGDLERCAFINGSEVGWICGTGCLLVRPPKSFIDGRWL